MRLHEKRENIIREWKRAGTSWKEDAPVKVVGICYAFDYQKCNTHIVRHAHIVAQSEGMELRQRSRFTAVA